MDAPRKKFSLLEGLYLVQGAGLGEGYSQGYWTKADVDALNAPPPSNCGPCCHAQDPPRREAILVIGRVEKGRVNGVPLQTWDPYVVDDLPKE